MTADEAQRALDDFWDEAEKNYGSDRGPLDGKERQKLLELEKQLIAAKKSDAAKN